MRLTARELAARRGVTDRSVRMAIAKGKLKGFRAPDPITEQEVWWVELPEDYPEAPEAISNAAFRPRIAASGSDPELGDSLPEYGETASEATSYTRMAGSGTDPEGTESIPEALKQALELVEKLHRENLELAGRLGWMTKELETTRLQLTEAHQKIALLEAPKAEEVAPITEPTPRPWWKFW